MLLTCKWHETRKSSYFLWIGLTVGLISLIRPTEVLILIVFWGYEVTSFADIKAKAKEVLFSLNHIIFFLFGFFAFWLPQMIYWKTLTDSFVYFSYGDERFFWTDPQIINFLLSYRKGWFVYTPIMLFSIIGLFFILKKKNGFKIPIIIYMIVNIYILSCWWCWWFGGSFGSRALVQTYALLAIPLAAFYEYIFITLRIHKIILSLGKSLVFFVFAGFLCLNVMQTYQCIYPKDGSLMHFDAMTKDAYWRIFGKFNLSTEDWEKFKSELHPPNYDAAKKGERNN